MEWVVGAQTPSGVMYSHGLHVDVTGLDPQPIFGMDSVIFQILKRFRMDLGRAWADTPCIN